MRCEKYQLDACSDVENGRSLGVVFFFAALGLAAPSRKLRTPMHTHTVDMEAVVMPYAARERMLSRGSDVDSDLLSFPCQLGRGYVPVECVQFLPSIRQRSSTRWLAFKCGTGLCPRSLCGKYYYVWDGPAAVLGFV